MTPNFQESLQSINEGKLFPQKFYDMMNKLVADFHAKKLTPHVEETTKALSDLEHKCQKQTVKYGEASRESQSQYDSLFDSVYRLRKGCLAFTNITKLSVKAFSDDEELEDMRDVKITPEDLDKMFQTTQEQHFYHSLAAVDPNNMFKKQSQNESVVKSDPNEEHSERPGPASPQSAQANFSEFFNRLNKCYNRDLLDALTAEYWEHWHTKSNFKKLLTAIQGVSSSQSEILPFFARFIANLQHVLPELPSTVTEYLILTFHKSVGHEKLGNIDFKLKIVRFMSILLFNWLL